MENKPLEIIIEEIRKREEERAQCAADVANAQHRMEELDVELGPLRAVRQRVEKACPPTTSANGLVSPTQAIVDLLKLHPNGLRTGQIARELENRIVSASNNRRRLLHSLTDQLFRRGKIVRDLEGVNTLPEPN
jgi:hypothetical protein